MADNALNQWIEEEAALKARLALAAGEDRKATYVTPDLVSEHTGLEIMQGIADGLFHLTVHKSENIVVVAGERVCKVVNVGQVTHGLATVARQRTETQLVAQARYKDRA